VKTLYLSDLDGTLLRNDERLSPYTLETLNRLIASGVLFGYATARSFVTASRVAAGLNVRVPVICYNGAFTVDSATGVPLSVEMFTDAELAHIKRSLTDKYVFPIVYAMLNGAERMTYIERFVSPEMQMLLDTRKGDKRTRIVDTIDELYAGEAFSIACIDSKELLFPAYQAFRNDTRFHSIYSRDIYNPGNQCMELTPKTATKGIAALKLKQTLGCERLVVFGDQINDIPMFNTSDESYAVSSAVDELKQIATGIIGSNNEDGVAKWMANAIN
jgi:hypothetical protein